MTDMYEKLTEWQGRGDDCGQISRYAKTEIDALRTQVAALTAEPTQAMVAEYLTANDTYWAEVDACPPKIGVWRNGTPEQATLVGLRAALAGRKGDVT